MEQSSAGAPGSGAEATIEVGAIGGDLPYWRAREAVRHAEVHLNAQAQAAQALEGRATAIMGWSVTGMLVLGAAVVHRSHVVPALAAAWWLVGTATLCVWAMVTRNFDGVPGFPPKDLLSGGEDSEYVLLVRLAKGYQEAIDDNAAAIRRLKRILAVAICLLGASPLCGLLVLLRRAD